MKPDATYLVRLQNGENRAYDRVNVLENGWLSGWIDTPEQTINEKIPPSRIELVTNRHADPTGPLDEDHDAEAFREYSRREAADD